MRQTQILGVILLFVLAPAVPASGWNGSGLMQVAMIAWQRLDAGTRLKIIEVIRKHPQFQDEFQTQMPPGLQPEDSELWLFAQAATWPDIARDYPKYHHGSWHYVNLPFYLRPGDELWRGYGKPNLAEAYSPKLADQELNAFQALDKCVKQLKNSATKPRD